MADERIPQSITKRVPLKAYLSSDHVSPATGKTIAVTISKNGAAFANPSAGATNATEIANGWYYVDLSTTDTGTLGPLIVRGTAATIDDAEAPPLEVVSAHNAGFDALPAVAAEAAGGLYTRGSGAGQINQPANGMIDGNVVRWLGTAAATPNTAGVPLIDVGRWVGVVPNALTSGKVDAALVIRGGTAQAGAAGSLTLDAGASATDNLYRGLKVLVASGTGAGQCRLVTGYTGSTKVATVAPNWVTNPDATSVFVVGAWAGVDVEQWALSAPNALISGRVDASAGAVADKTGYTVSTVQDKTGYTVSTVQDKTGYTVSTVQDKTGYSLSAGGVQAIWDALTSALVTVNSIGSLLTTNINAAINSRMATFSLPANFSSLAIDVSGRIDLGKWLGSVPAALSGVAGYVQTMLRRWLTDDAAGTPLALSTNLVQSTGGGGGGGGGTIYGSSGSIAYTYTVTKPGGSIPLAGATVWVSSDLAGVNRSQAQISDALGRVQFNLDPSTVYFWRRHSDWVFVDPDSQLIS